jgi:hypothetical protein
MAAQVDRCTVTGEEVVPQPGGFYGGRAPAGGERLACFWILTLTPKLVLQAQVAELQLQPV